MTTYTYIIYLFIIIILSTFATVCVKKNCNSVVQVKLKKKPRDFVVNTHKMYIVSPIFRNKSNLIIIYLLPWPTR